VQLLVEAGADINAVTKYNESALRVPSRTGQFPFVRFLLDLGALPDVLQWTSLENAIAFGTSDEVAAEVRKGCSLAHRDYWSRTPWLLAVHVGWTEKAALLLQAGADPSILGRCKKTALMFAADQDDVEMLKWLLARGADPRVLDEFGHSLVKHAVTMGSSNCLAVLHAAGFVELDTIVDSSDLRTLSLLLDAGADIDTISDEGYSLLMHATEAGDLDRVRFLLGKGANANATSTGEAALLKAISLDHIEIAKLLLKAGADPNQRDVDGYGPLAFCRTRRAVHLLLDSGADPLMLSDSNRNQIDLLASMGGDGIGTYAHRIVDQQYPGFRGSPLHAAACLGDLELLRRLLHQNGDPNLRDAQGRTPLHWLSSRKKNEAAAKRILATWSQGDVQPPSPGGPLAKEELAIDLLMEQGALLEARSTSDETPLVAALQWGQEDTARLLIARGADVSASDETGWTPTLLAAATGRVSMLDLVLDHGGSLNDVRNGWSALNLATHHGHIAMVRHLLSKGMDPNQEHRRMRLSRPLHSAAIMSHLEIVEALLSAGADAAARDGDGLTAMEYAKNQTIVDRLRAV